MNQPHPTIYAVSKDSTLWEYQGELYRQPAYLENKRDSTGTPLGWRWECSVLHFERYRAKGVFGEFEIQTIAA